MRVLHVHSGNIFGGVERMLEALAPAHAGEQPIASSYALCFRGATEDALRSAGAEILRLPAVRLARVDRVLRARRALRRVLNPGRWDVVCVHSSWAQAIFGPEVLRCRIPLVRWMHAPLSGSGWLDRWAARSSPALILCNSRYTRATIESLFRRVRYAVQYPPAVPSLHAPGDRQAVRAELGTAADQVVILIAARMERWKGHVTLLRSLSQLPPGPWEVWIAGGVQHPTEQAYVESLREHVASAGLAERVRFLGQRTDVPRLMAGADVYCQPNHAPEPFGLVFVEALAAGLPVITTALGGATEIVGDDCGILLKESSPAALAQALAHIIPRREERTVLSDAARLRGGQFCDLPRSLSELAAHLKAAIHSVPHAQ